MPTKSDSKAADTAATKLYRIIAIPLRALCKARDLYVRSMIRCSNVTVTGVPIMGVAPPSLPRSFSTSSNSEEDLRELIRASSRRVAAAMPPRSVSVAMGRIDEDRPCYYSSPDMNSQFYRRSKSHAVEERKARTGRVTATVF